MSLKGSATALRIDLQASRYYRWLIWLPHLLSFLLMLALSWHQALLLLCLPLLGFSLYHYQRDYKAKSRWRQLRCYRDGRVECHADSGAHEHFLLQHRPMMFSVFLILPLGRGGRRYYLPLFADAMARQQWLDLRRFLRYSLD